MTYFEYAERQKALIRDRHEGEVYLIEGGEFFEVDKCEKLLRELSELKGLNKRERILAS